MNAQINTVAQPNLREYTNDEAYEIAVKWLNYEEAGNIEEAEKYRREIPLYPIQCQGLKEEMGIQALIETGWNLSLAVKEYGEEWLK